MEKNKILIVLGMHRSGTSAIAGMLKHLGVRFGRHLMPAMPGINDKGFYEDLKIVQRNEAILAQLDRQWLDFSPMPNDWWQMSIMQQHQQAIQQLIQWYADHGLAGFKDPRLCRLLPLWLNAFTAQNVTPHFIIMLRDPDEVASSLRRRDAMDSGAAYGLWLSYMLAAEQHTRPYPRTFIGYSRLLTDWRSVVRDIDDAFGVAWPADPDSIGDTLDDFVDSRLNHHVSDRSVQVDTVMSDGLRDQAKQLFSAMQVADWQACSAVQASFAQTIQEMSPILPFYTRIQLLLSEKKSLGRDLQAEKNNATAQIEYRDTLLQQMQAALQAEKHNAVAQIEYRDALSQRTQADLQAEKNNAVAQIEYRDALLEQTQAALQAEKDNAVAQIEYRDALLEQMQAQIDQRDATIKYLQERTVTQVAREKIIRRLSCHEHINQGLTRLRQFSSHFFPERRR